MPPRSNGWEQKVPSIVGVISAVIVGGIKFALSAIGTPVDIGDFKDASMAILLVAPGFLLVALLSGAVARELSEHNCT